jgi:hypothetical protein
LNTPLLIHPLDSASFEAGLKVLSVTLRTGFLGEVMILSFVVTEIVAGSAIVHQMSGCQRVERAKMILNKQHFF